MERLSADLVPYISDPTASMVLVRLVDVKATTRPGGERESGTLVAEVREVLRSHVLKVNDRIEVPFERAADPIARAHQGFDHWNRLPLEPGQLVIFALQRRGTSTIWTGLAASAVESVNSAELQDVRQAIRIETSTGPSDRWPALLEPALTSGHDVLLLYALDAVGRRRLVDRPTGTQLLVRILDSKTLSPSTREGIIGTLTRRSFFDERLGFEPSNAQIVSAIAAALVNETNPKKRTLWMKYLGSCVLGKFSRDPQQDLAARIMLVKAVKAPPADEMIAALSQETTHGSEGEQRIARRLLDLWLAPRSAGP